ncbi:MAG: DUF4358 domain-containing protein [Erysipelotrichia bacterium]|nr:DUF4358 domain-containing protein [Erysipelotrichia bacterium]
MLKKFVSSLIITALLAGCSSSSAAASAGSAADVAGTASKIVSDLKLTDKMDSIESKIVQGLFFFEDGIVTSDSVYIANDKTADTVAVFATTNVDSCRESISTYLKTQKEQMQNYYPDEVFKIDNAIVEDNGSEVIMVVCNDIETAQKEVDSLLGK